MGRDKPTRVEGTPRGLGLYRRQGREGFFFVKNWSHLAKRYPGAFERDGQFDEWIKRADGSIVASLNEAKAYCYSRNAELERRKLALQGQYVSYSGEDLEAIAQQLADQWLSAKRRGVNLQHLDLGLWRATEVYKDRIEELERLGLGGALVMPPMRLPKDQELPDTPLAQLSQAEKDAIWQRLQEPVEIPDDCGPTYVLPLGKLKEEGHKLERLCWDQGFLPSPVDFGAIRRRFTDLILAYVDEAESEQTLGRLTPPKPVHQVRGLTWERLTKAKEAEGIALGTLRGMRKAVERLSNWLSQNFAVRLPTGIDAELAVEYRAFLFSSSGLRETSAAKELRYIRSAFQAAKTQGLIDSNPFSALPKDRRSNLRTRMATQKTVDNNKIITPERFQQIFRTMRSNKQGNPDPSFDLFVLQALTGARIQEVAGLRKCDFTVRKAGERIFRCIEIRHWDQRGLGAIGSRGGLKTVQSQRCIPLPKVAHALWEKYAESSSQKPAFPQEAPSSSNQHWGDRLARLMREKCKRFGGTHAWRESLINFSCNQGTSPRVIEMLTGKTGSTNLSDYTSDDLTSMERAIEANAEWLGLKKEQRCTHQ